MGSLQRAVFLYILLLLHRRSCATHLRRTQITKTFKSTNATVIARPISTTVNTSTKSTGSFDTTSSEHVLDLRGKKVAILAVHMEGNLGDLMETTPLLRRLSEWGVHVDCYLSYWQGQDDEHLDKRLNPQVMKFLSSYIDNIFYKAEDFQSTAIGNRNYDVTIVAPGPAVNEHKHCLKDGNRPGYNVTMVWFGTGVLGRDEHIFQEEKSCLRLIAAREVVSKEIVDNWIKEEEKVVDLIDDSLVKSVLAGDLSFSFQPNYDAISQHRQQLRANELQSIIANRGDDWVVVFSRSHNFGPLNGPYPKGVWIDNEKLEVQVRTILGLTETYSLDSVIFASSSDLEDHDHYATLESDFNVNPLHTIICSTIEQMWALVDLAPRVVTDRYHPGVVSMIQDTPLTITRYTSEAVKLAGLYRMQSYDKNVIKQYNEYAFTVLKNIILHGAQTQKGAHLTQIEIEDWNGQQPDESRHEKESSGSSAQNHGELKTIKGKTETNGSLSSTEGADTKASMQSWSVSSRSSDSKDEDETDDGDAYKQQEEKTENYDNWEVLNDVEHSRKFGRGFSVSNVS